MESNNQSQHLNDITHLTEHLIIYCMYIFNDLEQTVTDELVASTFPPEIREPLNRIKQLLFIDKFPEILKVLKIENEEICTHLCEAIPPIYLDSLEESPFDSAHRADIFKGKLGRFFEEVIKTYHSAEIPAPSIR